MSSDTTNKLTRILHTFDAQRLGEGDMSAGANVIAAMACAIANIHRHGTRIALGDDPSFRIGNSVLAYGPLTSALVAERVTGVATYHPRLDRIEERFRSALRTAWLKRLDYTTEEPETLAFDLSDQQAGWVAFLQQKEADFPGISAAARPLLATLLFGLHQMVKSLPKPEGLTLPAADVEALARILVTRMVNARAVILHDASKEDRERKLQVMLEKLSAGPTSVRDLTRKHHRLSANDARDLLSELVTRGKVVEIGGDRYQPAPATWQHTALTLEA